jgi:alkanesulfonate monooxygenase SsuD/methylene tetrahydromethanopterin reductase-like flavin-dependent oxidoreductase (luciferase family)
MVEAWTVAGDPSRCVDDLRRFVDQGVRRITLRITGWQQAEQYKRLVNDVLPKV